MTSEATTADKVQNLKSVSTEIDKMTDVALEAAARLGAKIKVSASAAFDHKLEFKYGSLSLVSTQQNQSLSIVAHKDQRKGSSSTNILTPAQVQKTVEEAVQISRFSIPDESLTMAEKAVAGVAKPLDFMFDDATARLDQEALQFLGKQVVDVLMADKRMRLDNCDVALSVSFNLFANSNGVRQKESQSLVNWQYFGMAGEGSDDEQEVTGFDYDGGFAYNAKNINERAVTEAKLWRDRLIKTLRPVTCPSYKGLVVFSPRAFEETLLSMILYHVSGGQVMDGKSRWIEKVGAKVLPTWFDLYDSPHDARHMGATAFDSDGLVTPDHLSIVESGVLKTHLHDLYTAKRCKGAKSTASAGGPFGLTIKSGKRSLKDLLNAATDVLFVDRFSGNADPISGAFSGVAKASRIYKNGVDCGAVTETMIAGNLFEAGFSMVEASSESQTVMGQFTAPHILLDGVSVTGSDVANSK